MTEETTQVKRVDEFIGQGRGLNGDIKLKVKVAIESIEVIEDKETVGIGDLALNNVPQRIIDKNSLDVDGVTGATITSDGIKEAVQDALEEAVETITGHSISRAQESASESDLDEYSTEDNQYVTRIDGAQGPIVIRVTTPDGQFLENVEILEHNETPGIGSEAIDQIPQEMVSQNSIDVDSISGATSTSEAIKEGVRSILSGSEETQSSSTSQFISSAIGPEGPITLRLTSKDGQTIQNIEILPQDGAQVLSQELFKSSEPEKVETSDTVNIEETDATSGASMLDTEVDLSEYESDDNQYLASGGGLNGPIVLRVTSDDKETIQDVEVLDHSETEGIGTLAIDELPSKMTEKNTTDIDNISGATVTSIALKEAVEKALKD